MMRWAQGLGLILVWVLVVACAGPGSGTATTTERVATEPRTVAKKTLVALMNDEPKKLGPVGAGGGSLQSSATIPFLYESFLAVLDGAGNPHPRLATELPTLENGGWRLHPDGRMETTFRLRPDAYWHDGARLTAGDFAFTWEVWNDPLSEVTREVLNLFIDRVETPDDLTITYHWKSSFAFVGQVARRSVLPRHLLDETFRADKEQFNNHRYNTTDYVGLGPYRLKAWVPGGHLELDAFERYFLGKPKIDTIVARFVPDPNVLTTTLLAGAAEMNIPWGAVMDVVTPLQQQWTHSGDGRVMIYPGPSLRFITHQNRDDIVKPAALKQLPVRQALMHGLDKEALVDLLYSDRSLLADGWYAVGDPARRPFADVITSYAYDVRRAAQLLEQQGWRPGPDGVLVNMAGDRFETSLTSTNESGQAVASIAAYWRQLGLAVQEDVLSPVFTQDREYRAKFAGMEYTANVPIRSFLNGRIPIQNIPASENRWTGSNRSGLNDPVLDRLFSSWDTTIDRSEQGRIEREMLRHTTANLSFGFLFFYPHQWMVRNSVTGVTPSQVASSVDDWPRVTWNAHEWDLKS